MSELIQNNRSRSESLFDFAAGMVKGGNGKALIERYGEVTGTVTAVEAMEVFDRLLSEGYDFEKVRACTGKIINVFFRSLSSHEWEKPAPGHFLYYMMEENRRAEGHIAAVRPYIRSVLKAESRDPEGDIGKLRQFIETIRGYELHYVKKELILFPVLESCFEQHRCLRLMWSFHDDFRRSIRALDSLLRADVPDIQAINSELGILFFVIIPIIFREEQIVFPVALRAITVESWRDMLEQSRETGWCFGVSPVYPGYVEAVAPGTGKIDLGTGQLTADQVLLMLNHLPVDITFVDENDEVGWFSGSEHRIFPRSKAIIGRKVQNCHPHDSVGVVNEILKAFREGSRDHADFRIRMKGRFIHIRYFAVRDGEGVYRGTIEVSQDITEIRELEGEQRLLDWK